MGESARRARVEEDRVLLGTLDDVPPRQREIGRGTGAEIARHARGRGGNLLGAAGPARAHALRADEEQGGEGDQEHRQARQCGRRPEQTPGSSAGGLSREGWLPEQDSNLQPSG